MITLTKPAVCLDQWQCGRDWRGNETTWRMSVADKVAAWAGSECPQCGGRFVTAAEVAAALLTPDAETAQAFDGGVDGG